MKEKSRTEIEVVSYGSCSTDEIRCLGTGRIYIRPIQTDITLAETVDLGDQTEECLLCGKEILLTEMRKHAENNCFSIEETNESQVIYLDELFKYRKCYNIITTLLDRVTPLSKMKISRCRPSCTIKYI